MTSRTAGRLSATSTLVSQPETSDPIQPRSTIQNPCTPPSLTSALIALSRIYPQSPTQHQEHDDQKTKRFHEVFFILVVLPWESNYNPASQSTTACASCICFAPFFHSSRAVALFFPQISHWLRTCDPVCLFPRPLWKESVLARGPDVEHCCSPTGAHMPHSEETPLLVYTVNHHWIIKP